MNMADDMTNLRNSVHRSTDSQDPFVYARHDLADARFDARLVPEVCDIFSGFSDDHPCIFGGDKRTEGEGIRTRWRT